jgi:hypothetical protein
MTVTEIDDQVLVGRAPDGSLQVFARRRRIRDGVLLRLCATRLDEELAAGRPADGERLRAMRAQTLIALPARRELAQQWAALLARAERPSHPTLAQVPVRRTEIMAARAEIDHLIYTLRPPQPISARGVARAGLLLTDGTGPVYNRRSGRDLAAELRAVLAALDPFTELGWSARS